MWQKKVKKTIYTLNTNNFAPKEITDITYPLLKHYAYKIGADFVEIKERKFPEWTPTYEKCQVYQLGQEAQNDWNIFIDYDALVHPDTPDVTSHLPREMCAHNGSDMNSIRWKDNRFFQRDGRRVGSASWLCIASDWTIELFKPMEDMTPEETYAQIFPVSHELQSGVEPRRLIEDYVFSYNIAKYGLKFDTVIDIFKRLNVGQANWLWHIYAVPFEEKIVQMRNIIRMWGLA